MGVRNMHGSGETSVRFASARAEAAADRTAIPDRLAFKHASILISYVALGSNASYARLPRHFFASHR